MRYLRGLSTSLGWGFVLFLILPMIGIALYSLQHRALPSLADPDTQSAIVISLKTCAIGVLVIGILGTPLALLIATSRGSVKALLESVVALPIVLPPAAAGIGLLLVFGRTGLLGPSLSSVGIHLPFSAGAVVIAQVFVAAPYYIRNAAEAFGSVNGALLEAAALDGADRRRVFWSVVIPLSAPLMSAGMVLAFARALGEFGATILFAGNLPGVTQTMPLAIYVGFEGNLANATGLALLLLIVAAFAIVVAQVALPGGKAKWAE